VSLRLLAVVKPGVSRREDVMRQGRALGDREQAVAAFVARELGCEATQVVRVDAFATNAVYAVDADGQRCVVKASRMHNAVRAEAWACVRGADAGCAAPAILGLGRLGTDDSMSAFIMHRVAGGPIVPGHPALLAVGIGLRRLHAVRLPGFGWLAEASWDERGDCALRHRSWLGFLKGICGDARHLADSYAVATAVAEAAAAALDAHAAALAAVEVGSLCHGDLKAAHIFVEAGRLVGVIDWGDAVVGDPLWDLARFAHRADAESVALLLAGYDPERALVDALGWRVPLYGVLWRIVDALVAHRLGHRVEAMLEAAMGALAQQAG
jgi:aminoglycoside phosphotransferase (APT) family kinase protein